MMTTTVLFVELLVVGVQSLAVLLSIPFAISGLDWASDWQAPSILADIRAKKHCTDIMLTPDVGSVGNPERV